MKYDDNVNKGKVALTRSSVRDLGNETRRSGLKQIHLVWVGASEQWIYENLALKNKNLEIRLAVIRAFTPQ